MAAFTLYILFVGTLFVGIRTGILIERKRVAHKKIKDRLQSFPDEVKVIGNIYDELSSNVEFSPITGRQMTWDEAAIWPGTFILSIDEEDPFQIKKPN